jgi:hypothetical protein
MLHKNSTTAGFSRVWNAGGSAALEAARKQLSRKNNRKASIGPEQFKAGSKAMAKSRLQSRTVSHLKG